MRLKNKIKVGNNEIMESDRIIVSTGTICELLGVSRTTVKNWADEGCPRYEKGWWDLKEVFKWRGLTSAKEIKNKKDEEDLTLKERKLYYEMKYKEKQAENIQIKNEIEKGEYLSRNEVKEETELLYDVLKNSLYKLKDKITDDLSDVIGKDKSKNVDKLIEIEIMDNLSQMKTTQKKMLKEIK